MSTVHLIIMTHDGKTENRTIQMAFLPPQIGETLIIDRYRIIRKLLVDSVEREIEDGELHYTLHLTDISEPLDLKLKGGRE